MVKLPIKATPLALGDSENVAFARLKSIEKQFKKSPALTQKYVKFMREYQMLGHIKEVSSTDTFDSITCYLPHHAVITESSTTTKLRVVFDGSSKSTNGKSLNDFLHYCSR